jgi:hypothetical protein
MAGTWDCAVDLNRFYEDHKPTYSRELLSFLASVGKSLWLDHPSFATNNTVIEDRDCSGEGGE